MDHVTLILLITAAFALIFGPLTARSSMKRDEILGGPVAKFFNLIGSITFVGLAPGVLCALFLGEASHIGLPMALTLLAVSLIAFLLFAILELPARKANKPKVAKEEEEEVWTAEKARTSGL